MTSPRARFPSDKPRLVLYAAVVAAMLLLFAALIGFGARSVVDPDAGSGGAPSPAPAGAAPKAAQTPVSGLPTVPVADLPEEARATLVLIDRHGPFPYAKDGATFGNVERLLPAHDRGYYREYTVPTPGEGDRGARRLVVGTAGDVYYTGDHYESFRQVLR